MDLVGGREDAKQAACRSDMRSIEGAEKAHVAQSGTPSVSLQGQSGSMRASDHQFQQTLVVGLMERQGAPGVKFDVEGSGYGFRVIRTIEASAAEMPNSCRMARP